jgi:type VI secretion system protein
MPITLKIISYQRLSPGQQDSLQTDLSRFSIGRNEDNHWTLSDPQRFMSGTHCWLEERDGAWYITDTSTNGIFLNGADQRMVKNESVALNHGDRLRLGDYELEVDLQDNVSEETTTADIPPGRPFDPFGDDGEELASTPKSPAELKELNTPLAQMDSSLLGDSVSIDELYELDEAAAEEEPPPSLASQGDQASPLHRHFSAPVVEAGTDSPVPDKYAADLDAIPENWDEETGIVKRPLEGSRTDAGNLGEREVAPPARGPARAPRAEPPRQPVRRIQADSAIAAFASGAELDPRQLYADDESVFFHDLGALLKTVTEGLMQANKSRWEVKSEFRVDVTRIEPLQNNPFKFSASSEEAMSRLLNRNDKAFLSGSEAAAEAIDDITAHQVAVLAGTKEALKSIMRRFSPEELELKFGAGSFLARLRPSRKKARYWDFYKVLYQELSDAADDDFQQFFGDEFRTAYEKELHRLKISRKEPSQ